MPRMTAPMNAKAAHVSSTVSSSEIIGVPRWIDAKFNSNKF